MARLTVVKYATVWLTLKNSGTGNAFDPEELPGDILLKRKEFFAKRNKGNKRIKITTSYYNKIPNSK